MQTAWEGFLEAAKRDPEAIAVDDGASRQTYADLQERVTTYASALAAREIGEGRLVGVLMARDARLPAMLLAVFGAGAAYLPLDPIDPVDRKLRAARLAGVDVVVGNVDLLEALRSEAGAAGLEDLPTLIAVEDLEGTAPQDGPLAPPTPETLAYVLLTSGSTGEPKAVGVEHRNVTALLESARAHLEFTEADRYFATSSLTFDASVPELFLPLTTGATVVLRDRDIVLAPKKMVAAMEETGVSIVQTTPSTWATILAAVDRFPRVRILITHGEPVTPEFAAELATKADRVLNMYGPTETTVWATSLDVTPEITNGPSRGALPIGYTLGHVASIVADADDKPVDDGTPGELCLGGPSVTRGYMNDRARTAHAFFERDGTRYYRTGDLVERAGDGLLSYLGRIDDQMAINGLRIEPGEIEAALTRHPAVARAAVTWYPASPESRSIVAAVVPEPGKPLTQTELRDHLAKTLNRSFLPSQYLFFGALPTLTSGKVDRKVIRAAAAEATRPAEPEEEHAPAADINPKLLEVWTSVLKLSQAAPGDDFFAVGGDSLKAVDLMVRIEKAFGIDLAVQDIFEHPTLAALSAHVSDMAPEPKAASLIVRHRSDLPGPPIFFAHADLDYPNGVGAAIPAPFCNLMLWSRAEGIVNEASLKDLAEKYIGEIQAVQKTGPYRLAGYSIGGILIHEVARQLVDAGHAVDFLFLLDPTPPGFVETSAGSKPVTTRQRNLSSRISTRLHRVVQKVRSRREGGWARALVEAPRYLNEARHWWSYRKITASLSKTGEAQSSDFDEMTRWRAIRYAVGRMVARHVAKPLDVPTVVVTSHEDMLFAWEELLSPDVPRHQLTSDHRSVFREPLNSIWTEILVAQLDAGSDVELRRRAGL